MTNKSINSIRYPLVLICIALCISGFRWLISSEPWMLDQVANEERLQITFIDLFLIELIVEAIFDAFVTDAN